MTDNPSWQPTHDDPLFILAMDHRASFGKTLFDVKDDNPDPDQIAAMKSAKSIIFEGLRAALPAVTYGRAGVLVDERYGQDVIDAVKAGGSTQPVALAVPVEASGHDWFTLEWGDQWLEHVEAIRPDYAKILVRDNPDFAIEYLKAALEEDSEPRVLLIALRRVVQARGIAKIAKTAGVERESLYRALSKRGNPRLSTLAAVTKAVGLRLTVEAADNASRPIR